MGDYDKLISCDMMYGYGRLVLFILYTSDKALLDMVDSFHVY